MLKSRLFAAQVAVMLLIAVAAALGYWHLRDQAAAFDRAVSRNFDAMRVLNESRVISTNLESLYLPALAREEAPDADARIPLEQYRRALRANLDKLDRLARQRGFGARERAAISAFRASVMSYIEQFERFFALSDGMTSAEERIAMRAGILSAGVSMADHSDALLQRLNEAVVEEKNRAMQKASRNTRILLAILLAPLLLAGVVYYVIDRLVIDPVVELTESIRKVQRQDFEAVLPVRRDNEVGRLAMAFNDMSAELRIMKLEADREMLRLGSESRAIVSGFPYPVFILRKSGEVARNNPSAEQLMSSLNTRRKLPLKLARLVADCIQRDSDYLAENVNEALLFRCDEKERWFLPGIFRICDRVEGTDKTCDPVSVREGNREDFRSGSSFEPFEGWAVVLIDVTRVRWLDDMKSDMIGTVSHEIKTPLTSIRIVLHLLAEQRTGRLNASQKRIVGSAIDDCERLLGTLDNLLQLSRMESGQDLLDLDPVEPEQLLEDARASYSAAAADKGVTVTTRVEGDLPRVGADRIRVSQVFGNLISNAVKHSPEGAEVVLSATQQRRDCVTFEVVDHGAGVSELEQDRIFERFYRSPGEKGIGTGLGLSICREIVRAHGGRIGVESEPGRKTTFFFELPTSSA